MNKNKILFFIILGLSFISPHTKVFTDDVDTLDVIISDFQVSETGGLNTIESNHDHSDIAIDSQGNFIVTWVDDRWGLYPDIYAQRYLNDGSPVGENFMVNDRQGWIYHMNPSVAIDNNGNFVITWYESGEDENIYAQRYSCDGDRLGPNFLVNTEQGAIECDPCIAMADNGNFIVVWVDYKNESLCVYGQLYSNAGYELETNFEIGDNERSTWKSSPSVSSNSSEQFVVIWRELRENGGEDIYAQRYSRYGNPLGTNFKVNDDLEHVELHFPVVACDSSGNFVVAWDDWHNIYAQRFSSEGVPLGKNFVVNDDSAVASNCSVAMDVDGDFVITWEDEQRTCDYDIYAQRYSNTGQAMGVNFIVNYNLQASWQHDPEVAMTISGDFIIAWTYGHRILVQRYQKDGILLEQRFRVMDDNIWATQSASSICTDTSGNFVVAWVDQRNGSKNPDIYIQQCSANGQLAGVNMKVNDDLETAHQSSPSICANEKGEFVVTWCDGRNGNSDIYAQRYTSNGALIGSNFRINDDSGSYSQGLPAIACNDSGYFIITWVDYRDDKHNWQVYAQRYSADGAVLGHNFKISDDIEKIEQGYPAVGIDNAGNFVIAWYDHRYGDYDIFIQRYTNRGIAIGKPFKVSDDLTGSWQVYPSISMNREGHFVVTWMDKRNGDYDIYAQRYSNDGTALGGNFRVNDDTGSMYQKDPSISLDDNANFIIVWEAWNYDNYDIYGQRYTGDGSKLGTNFKIGATNDKDQSAPDVVLINDRIYTTWSDNHSGFTVDDTDIRANVLDWGTTTELTENEYSEIPFDFQLHQNYPNPFNSSTVISYQLPADTEVALHIFNSVGQRVATLVSERQSADSYQVKWNAGDVASGIYVYRLVTGEGSVQTRKLVLLK